MKIDKKAINSLTEEDIKKAYQEYNQYDQAIKKPLNFITFKQFIYTINIRYCPDSDTMDNKIIRLLFNDVSNNNYIDLGWYDYFHKDTCWEILEKMLNERVLESVVTDFWYDDKFDCICVCLQDKDYETLEDYVK